MSEVGDGATIVVKSQMQVGPGLELRSSFYLLGQCFYVQLSRIYTVQGSKLELKFRLHFSQQGVHINSALQLPRVRDKSSS